jgi:hypothetical protein
MDPVKQYEVWRVGDNHSGYPVLVTNDREEAEKLYNEGGYDVYEYTAYPVI